MINYTDRLDQAIKVAARAHDKVHEYRKGTDIPYIIHPFGVMIVASSVTDDEDILIACLLHDVLEDVAAVDPSIYNADAMRTEFGERVTQMVIDVSKKEGIGDWRATAEDYMEHLRGNVDPGSLIVSASDKIQNLMSIVQDYKTMGDDVWGKFTTANKDDQVWYYQSMIEVLKAQSTPETLTQRIESLLIEIE